MFKHRPTHIQSHLRLHGLPQKITSKSQHLSGLQSQECLSNLDDNRNRQHRPHLPKKSTLNRLTNREPPQNIDHSHSSNSFLRKDTAFRTEHTPKTPSRIPLPTSAAVSAATNPNMEIPPFRESRSVIQSLLDSSSSRQSCSIAGGSGRTGNQSSSCD